MDRSSISRQSKTRSDERRRSTPTQTSSQYPVIILVPPSKTFLAHGTADIDYRLLHPRAGHLEPDDMRVYANVVRLHRMARYVCLRQRFPETSIEDVPVFFRPDLLRPGQRIRYVLDNRSRFWTLCAEFAYRAHQLPTFLATCRLRWSYWP
jgi:hypothetical protein